MDYFGARYFSGAQGRFTSPDPLDWLSWQNGNEDDQERFQAFISDPQGFNKYAYARNNPLKYVDPTGEDFEPAVTFNGDATDEEKARILGAIRQYLVNLKIGNVVVRGAAVKSGDKRTWGQTVKDFFNKDYQTSPLAEQALTSIAAESPLSITPHKRPWLPKAFQDACCAADAC